MAKKAAKSKLKRAPRRHSKKRAAAKKKPARAKRPRARKRKPKRPPLIHPEGYYFDETAAENAVLFFEKFLVHVKGEWAGQPFKLTAWEREEIIRPGFGWKRPDGTRQYRMIYVEVPRKNGKSTLAAGVALYLLVADQEPGAEIYSAANDQSQASIVFDIAKRMARAKPALKKRLQVYRYAITAEHLGASYKVLSSKAQTKDGLNAHGVIFDELHKQPNRELWDVLTTAGGTRRQPMVFVITTAGFDKHSICREQHDYALKVRAGIINDPDYLPIICAADKDDDITDEKVWTKANPNLGITIKRDYLARQVARAAESPAYENTVKRLHFNIWTEQDVRWLSMQKWDACARAVREPELLGRPCYAGLDLGSVSDLTSLVLLFPDDDGPWPVLPFFWLPADSVTPRVRSASVPYDVWVRDKLIRTTPGSAMDYDRVRRDINGIADKFRVVELAIDRLFQGDQLSMQLMGDGFEVVSFGQGFYSMAAPTKRLEEFVLTKHLAHGGHPVLRWMASNVSVELDAAGNMKPSKKKSDEKIDGIVALIMALGRAMLEPAEAGSVYEERGVLTI